MQSLRRPIQSMPKGVRRALDATGLGDACAGRPAYQRTDYLGWFARARQPATRQRRIEQLANALCRYVELARPLTLT